MSRSASPGLRELLFGGGTAPPHEIVRDADLFRRRFLLAEILARPMAERRSPVELARRPER